MDESERCDHVILLDEGEILAQGSPSQLTAPLEGHSFILESVPAAPRNLQSQIAQLPGVVDAAIQGDGLRIVMQQIKAPPLPEKLATYGSCLVTTQFMEEAEYCDRLVLMSLGEVLAEGTPTEIKARVRSTDHPKPSMEDAFISLIEEHERVSRRAS